jgi:hypothetical protein
VCFTAGSRRLRHVASAIILVVVISGEVKECNQSAVYEPCERNGIAEWVKMVIDFCILTETCGMCILYFRRTVCGIVKDAVDMK